MGRRFAAVLSGSLLALLVFGASAAPAPEFRLGFAALAGQIPDVVGQPLENEHYGANGDSLQQTTTGLMVWRKADNWTAFTDGATTWINGPAGVVSRPNNERFHWEAKPSVAVVSIPTPPPANPTAAPAPTPAPAPRFYSPDVKAMDAEAGGPGVMVKQLMAELHTEWAKVWGWQPRRPVTVYLYFDGYHMADGVTLISGEVLSPADREFYARNAAGLKMGDARTGGYAVLMNLNRWFGTPAWEVRTKHILTHEYTHVMQEDVARGAGPTWFSEGMAELNAFTKVPAAAPYLDRSPVVSLYRDAGALPTLRQLDANWDGYVASSREHGDVAYGAAYLAVKHLSNKVGGMPLLQVIEATSRGEDFDVALQRIAGYTTDRLDGEYRSTIP